MQYSLSRYVIFAKRWWWLIVIGMFICSGTTYIVSKLEHPVYQASAILIINANPSSSNNTVASLAAVPTYAQLVTTSTVLDPVIAKHQGMTLDQLNSMIASKPESNTQLIELDVQNGDPNLAAELANEICNSFTQYANSQMPVTVQILPAVAPTAPIKPKPLQDTAISALVSLGLAIALIIIFEWIDDRLSSPEEVQTLLEMELLTVIPQIVRDRSGKTSGKASTIEEKYHSLCASLNTAKARKPFKVLMVTSSLAGEGKSTVAANLASYLAMTGKSVLLVDVNLRHPVLAQRYQLDNSRGLSNVFLEMWASPRAELSGQETNNPRLRVLTAGSIPSRPAELLQSSLSEQLFDYFKHTSFDYVIIDAPPVLPVADAQILASLVEAVIIVVDAHKTPRRAMVRTKHVLGKGRAEVLGVIINKSRWPDYENKKQYSTDGSQLQVDEALIMSLNGHHQALIMPPNIPQFPTNSFTPTPMSPNMPPATMVTPPNTPPATMAIHSSNPPFTVGGGRLLNLPSFHGNGTGNPDGSDILGYRPPTGMNKQDRNGN
jgi:succinoglycan biosynthesis transport protein ExoP